MSWRQAVVRDQATIREAVAAIDSGELQIALVVDSAGRLVGTVTDGDVRRAILRGIGLDGPVSEIMNRSPTSARLGTARDMIAATMKEKRLHQIPIIDGGGHIVGLETIDDLVTSTPNDTIVVLMAGGPGTRLRPLTENTPKPLLAVGAKPLIETILDTLVGYGFRRFYIAVNYKKEMIKKTLGDGCRWGAEIRYLEESERMGTAGALALLPQRPTGPVLVMNGDLLTTINFKHLLQYHREQACAATLCVHEHVSEFPFGVIEIENNRARTIEEKPLRRCFINAGIYVLEPAVIAMLARTEYCDMPTLVGRAIAADRPVAVFPIREFWLDIGRHDDFRAANGLYTEFFK